MPLAAATVTNALVGRVADQAGAPLADAVVVASGTSSNAAVTGADGRYTMDLDSGTYEIQVSHDGFTSKTVSGVVVKDVSVTLDITLVRVAATGGSRRVNVSAQSAINSSSSTYRELPEDVIGLSYQPNLNTLVGELPGTTIVQSTGASPDSSFELRGGVIETVTQIDGHAISSGAYGRWNSHYADAQLFQDISTFSGPGFFGVNSGQGGFGIIDLRTAGFIRAPELVTFDAGLDQWAGDFASLTFGGNALKQNRLSYIFQANAANYRGPFNNQLADDVATGPNNTAVIAFEQLLNSQFTLDSQTAKIRYQFSPNVSFTAAYTGIQSDYNPQGATYGVYTGMRTIVGSLQTPGGLLFNAPYAQNQIGSLVPTYQWFPNSEVQTNQPLFDEELHINPNKLDTFLIRPYAGTIYSYTDGLGRGDLPQGSDNNAWFQVVDPGLCTTAAPCYIGTNPNPLVGPSAGCTQLTPCYTPNYDHPYVDQELDRLHGVTLTYIHPVANNTYTFGYDYHSDQTSAFAGDPSPEANMANTIAGDALQTVVAPTTSRNYDAEAVGAWQLSKNLRLTAADYYTAWNLAYQIEDPAVIAANPGKGLNIPLSLIGQTRTFYRNNPRIGVALHASDSTSYRFTAGTSITYPYAILVSGVPNITLPSANNGNVGVLNLPNAALNPETVMMYDLGVDHMTKSNVLLSSDVFDYTTFGAFVLNEKKDIGPIEPGTGLPQYSLSAQTINAGNQRNYGFELSASQTPAVGIGFRVSLVLQRAYLEGLPQSLYADTASPYIDGKQLDGNSVVPYFRGFAEMSKRWRNGDLLSVGVNLFGSNNYTYGPGFATVNMAYQVPLNEHLSITASVENLFNYNTGTQSAAGIAGAGNAQLLYGPGPHGTFVYSSTPTVLQSVPPQTFRIQLQYKAAPRI